MTTTPHGFADLVDEAHSHLHDAQQSRTVGVWPLRWAGHRYPHLHRLLDANRRADPPRHVPDDLARFIVAGAHAVLGTLRLDPPPAYLVSPDGLGEISAAIDGADFDDVIPPTLARDLDEALDGLCLHETSDGLGSDLLCTLPAHAHEADVPHGWLVDVTKLDRRQRGLGPGFVDGEWGPW